MFRFIIFSLVFFFTVRSLSQNNNVGIGTLTPDSSAILEVKSNNKGVLIPRMTALQRLAISNPANGLLVFDTDSACFFFYNQSVSWLSLCSLKGSPGPTGPIGLSGIAGVTGVTGIAGLTGAMGATGAQGISGVTGATGITGSKGATGATGAQGIQGITGGMGAIGEIGPTGAVGAQGIQGIQGNTGASGATGPSGGPIGPIGPTGIANVQTFGVYGTGTTNLTGSFANIPGLSVTINLVDSATLNIFTFGAVNMPSFNDNCTNINVQVFMNNSPLSFAIQNIQDEFFAVPTCYNHNWSISTFTNLPAGNYTFEVKASETLGNPTVAGSTSNSKSSLIIQVFY